jgi:hypothetical protein
LPTRVRGKPIGLVAVDVAADLSGSGAERADELGELLDLALSVEGEPVCCESGPELPVGGDGGVPHAVDRVEGVSHADRVQAAPLPGAEHPGVDLQVQMPVRIAAREV